MLTKFKKFLTPIFSDATGKDKRVKANDGCADTGSKNGNAYRQTIFDWSFGQRETGNRSGTTLSDARNRTHSKRTK